MEESLVPQAGLGDAVFYVEYRFSNPQQFGSYYPAHFEGRKRDKRCLLTTRQT